MQRVLSFPMSRGFGESSEFVTKRMCFSFMFSIGFLALLSGFLLGRFALDQELALSKRKLWRATQLHQESFGENLNSTAVGVFAQPLSNSTIPHYTQLLRDATGTNANSSLNQANFLRTELHRGGFGLVSPLTPHQVTLSYPDPTLPNSAVVLDGRGEVVFTCNDSRPGFPAADGPSEGILSAVTAKGVPVYVNFGRDEDYFYLESLAVEVAGRVVLARAGEISARDAVTTALEHDVAAILLYLDPQQESEELDSFILSPKDLAALHQSHGISFVRGSPGVNSSLPVVVITAAQAERIFKDMSAEEPSPESWRGNLHSLYPIGPGFSTADWSIQVRVNSVNLLRTYYDVIAALPGAIEPDRHVILTAARDPWVSSELEIAGTAMLLELAKLAGDFSHNKGWRPRRSIVFAFMGLSGNARVQTEDWWTSLAAQSVAHINLDLTALGAAQMIAHVTPLLRDVYQRSAATANLTAPTESMLNHDDFALEELPHLKLQAHGAVNRSSTPATERVAAVAKTMAALMWELADSRALPFHVDAYVDFFNRSVAVLRERFDVIARRHALFLDTLIETIADLADRLKRLGQSLETSERPLDIRRINDQLVSFVRALTCPEERTPYSTHLGAKNVVFSRSSTATNDTAGFGVLQDLLREITSAQAPDDLQQKIVTLIADLVRCLRTADAALADYTSRLILGNT